MCICVVCLCVRMSVVFEVEIESPLVTFNLVHWSKASHMNSELADWTSLAGELALCIHSLSLPSEFWSYRWTPMVTWYFHEFWGSELGSLCLCGRPFSHLSSPIFLLLFIVILLCFDRVSLCSPG